ncbi:translation initiation factor IF-2 N-terminal domain-containing protein [Nocardia sp. CNY236]|uniref:translation initiation factor IF-2 N-terminal domain-containing protein n=1 Tax=Nocardia sp. CNY236 TaxID=1169152 RepID=UPI0004005788|nr:translation initiation factor IF-2 N-terminal domain-containing protein [Nocardia sp. CNY236]
MADQAPLETTSQDAEQLPERIRVHALAKMLGVTSKRILAELTVLGAEARSAQSNVERAVAESVRDALTAVEAPVPAAQSVGGKPDAQPVAGKEGSSGRASADDPVGGTTPPPAPAAPETALPSAAGVDAGMPAAAGIETNQPATAGAEADLSVAAETALPAAPVAVEHEPLLGTEQSDAPSEAASFTGAGVIFSAADASSAGQRTPPGPSAQLFTHSAQPDPVPVGAEVFESAAVVQAPLFLPPDAAAAEQERRQRRAEREARRVEEPSPEQDDEDGDVPDGDVTEDVRESAGQHGDVDGQPRRRRRGRRGRGRGRGEQSADIDGGSEESEDETDDQPTPAVEESADTADPGEPTGADAAEGDGAPDGPSRRRRRRRRRKVAGETGENDSAEDDPPNTVVHEREPRNKSRGRAAVDEVQGITGSTRLEAKRQRRRDGREAGRRRPPILTESEFLARREAVDRVMVVREKSFADQPTATQVAVLEDKVLVEHFVTNTGSASMVGNIYLGKVQNVLPSMEAAFVDIGRGRNGVLYAGEVNWEAAGLGGKERKIEQALKPGDQVLVQVSKDPVGHKGARLTTQISLAGRFLVYVPGGTSTGISRKLPDNERKRLKEILRDIVPADAGVIIRTASEGVSATELARDVERLQATWRTIHEQAATDSSAPTTLYEEPDLLVKVIRDLFNEDFSKLVIEGRRAWGTVEKYIGTVAPDLLARVARHENDDVDVFETYRIDEQLAKAMDRKVWLPSGGTLVIDRTEAMTVIDVNTGKFTGSGGGNLEETVTRNNLEAAEEIVRQMRLRDIGGMIVVDFIDMVLESNRDLVLRRLTESLGRDRTRHQVSEVTSLGLVQMTRKKLGTGLVEAFSTTCEHCHGRGIVVHTRPVESGADDESTGRAREGGSRRRRGRDRGALAQSQAANGSGATIDRTDEDAAAKRAHPVALAMAAHQSEETDQESESADEIREAATTTDAPAPDGAGDSDMGESAGRDEAVRVVEEGEVSVAAAGTTEVSLRAEESHSGVTEQVVEPEPGSTHQPAGAGPGSSAPSRSAPAPHARRRRAARSAAAPAMDSSGAVFVLPTGEQPPGGRVDYHHVDVAEVPPRTRQPRRAVGRPAGAPETTAH